jgi:hypothetical protein
MTDAKARALESEINMLRDEVKELRLLLSGENDDLNRKKRKQASPLTEDHYARKRL